MYEEIFPLLEQLIEGQKGKLLHSAKRIVPRITPDDLLQPNDFPELEHHPHFRYEEGILDGMQVVRAALHAFHRDAKHKQILE
ncbi:MAG TPA: hypothetical protein VHL30_02380 [Chlamydiales bacterium]|nr:hypothetical protein [Chlamydiales bacterium]